MCGGGGLLCRRECGVGEEENEEEEGVVWCSENVMSYFL